MVEKKPLILLITAAVVVVALLIIIIVPMSFSYLDYDEVCYYLIRNQLYSTILIHF
jgi:hypothetical protein